MNNLNNQISAFEYISILISIVLGLGIAQILSGISDYLHRYKRIRFYSVHLIWVIVLLYMHIQDWFITYEMKFFPEWKLPVMLFILLYPITLFLAARMLFPVNPDEDTDLKVYYHAKFPVLFVLFGILVLESMVYNIWLLHEPLTVEVWLMIPALIFFVIAGQKWDGVVLHRTLAWITLAAIVIVTILENNQWFIR